MKSRIILILCILFEIINFNATARIDNISSGLYFSSHEVIQDKRTSLHLTPYHPLTFNKKFRIVFDAQFRHGDGYYGIICRVIGNKNTNIDLISNLGAENTNFWLVYRDQILFSYSLHEIPKSEFGKWIKVFVDFDLKENLLTASFNGVKKSKKVDGLSVLKDFDIIFGACSNPKFLSTDVAPMTLKNVIIVDNNHKICRNWKLEKHTSDEVYDELQQDVATVKNGTWLIDQHVKWSKLISIKIPDLVGMAKNPTEGLIYFICKTKIFIYSVQYHSLDTIPYKSGCPFNNYYNYFIYNSVDKYLISYDFSENFLNEFNFETREWEQSSFEYKEPDLAHHNVIISPLNGELITFGGYGHYKYKSKFIYFRSQSREWQSKDVSNKIYPRYLSAAGLLNDQEWLIFGGYGSKSGRQEVSPEFYYDLYSYNLKNETVTKLQQYKSPEIPFVPCEALIKRPDSNSFYTLVYNTSNFTTSLRLAEFKIDAPEYILYPDIIPYNFSDIESWCMFFLYQKSLSLITVTAHKNNVAIYTLAYPALTYSEIMQTGKAVNKWMIWFVCALLFIGVMIFLLNFYKKKANRNFLTKNFENISETESTDIVNLSVAKHVSKSSIYFLGGFQIFDNEGNDISSFLTPTLKQLFIILLLNTIKNGRGISTNKLNEILWFDKSDISARNNRNVSISKLRTILDKVGNIDIDQESSYWRVKMTGVYSDYVELTNLCDRFRKLNSSLTETEIQHFVQVAYRGELLPEFQIDWLDEFKADFSNMILDVLFDFSNLSEIKTNYHLLNHIAECILKFDNINEEAIVLKCSTLIKLGKKGIAKIAYDSFAREYFNLLGTPYSLSFNEIVSKTE
jgi:two-component SAPR family response regulator